MSEPGIGLREIKKQMTRESIADAALQLALEKGLDQVTIEEIAHVAFVSPRTFSNYFSCKEEAVVAAGTQESLAMIEAFSESPADEPPLQSLASLLVEATRAASPEQLELSAKKIELSQQHPSLRPFQTAQYDTFEEALREAVATRTGTDVNKDLYPWLIAAISVTAVRSAVRLWALAEASADQLADLIQAAFDQIHQGLPMPRPTTSS